MGSPPFIGGLCGDHSPHRTTMTQTKRCRIFQFGHGGLILNRVVQWPPFIHIVFRTTVFTMVDDADTLWPPQLFGAITFESESHGKFE